MTPRRIHGLIRLLLALGMLVFGSLMPAPIGAHTMPIFVCAALFFFVWAMILLLGDRRRR